MTAPETASAAETAEPATLKSEFLQVLQARGYIYQATDLAGLDQLFSGGSQTCYIGFDATADSLHVGHLVQIMMLRWAQRTGHRPIALMGGGTTKLGDPSGKDTTRQMLSEDDIAANVEAIRGSFANYIDFESDRLGAQALMVNNADWLDGLAYIPFLREVGRHFSVNRMIAADSGRLRLEREQPLTFLEFNYMILQAYDFHELARVMTAACRWAGRISGATSSPASIWRAACPARTSMV